MLISTLDAHRCARLKDLMPTKPEKKPRPENRPMPEDPHDLARAMFRHGDKKMREKRETENHRPGKLADLSRDPQSTDSG